MSATKEHKHYAQQEEQTHSCNQSVDNAEEDFLEDFDRELNEVPVCCNTQRQVLKEKFAIIKKLFANKAAEQADIIECHESHSAEAKNVKGHLRKVRSELSANQVSSTRRIHQLSNECFALRRQLENDQGNSAIEESAKLHSLRLYYEDKLTEMEATYKRSLQYIYALMA